MSLHLEAVSEFRFIRRCSLIPVKTLPAGDRRRRQDLRDRLQASAD
jgi:hypothetical protein